MSDNSQKTSLSLSKYKHWEHPFTSLDTMLSDKCCLTCGFCYAKNNKPTNYDPERLDKTTEWFFSQYISNTNSKDNKKLAIVYYGGEPTCEWNGLEREAELRPKQAKELGLEISLSIVSNLALLNEEKINWLHDNNIGVSCSIDGCEEAEDYWRKFQDGTGASKFVFENAKIITKKKMSSTVRMTSTPQTVKWFAKSVKFLAEELGFTTINCVTASGMDWNDEALKTYHEQLLETNEWWIAKVREGKWHPLYYLNKKLPQIWGHQKGIGTCGAGKSMICADTNGNLWPCHRFAGGNPNSKYLLGNINVGITNFDMLERIKSLDFLNTIFNENCGRCRARFACSGFCMHEMSLNGENLSPHFCKMTEMQIEAAALIDKTLSSENNQIYLEHKLLNNPKMISKEQHQKYLEKTGKKFNFIQSHG